MLDSLTYVLWLIFFIFTAYFKESSFYKSPNVFTLFRISSSGTEENFKTNVKSFQKRIGSVLCVVYYYVRFFDIKNVSSYQDNVGLQSPSNSQIFKFFILNYLTDLRTPFYNCNESFLNFASGRLPVDFCLL